MALDEEIKTSKIKLATLLGVLELLVCFCSKCLVSEFHQSHVLEETTDGTVYRYVSEVEGAGGFLGWLVGQSGCLSGLVVLVEGLVNWL